jgi:hypothetical protein
MTHAELRRAYWNPGIEPADCPGEPRGRPLRAVDPVDGHEVQVYRCRTCGNTIVVDHTANVVRNDYRDPGK